MADFNEMYDVATHQDAAKDVEMPYLAHYENQSTDPDHPDVGDQGETRTDARTSHGANATSDTTDGGTDGASADVDAEGRMGEVDRAAHGDASADGGRDEMASALASEEVKPRSLTHTDQQEAIQTTPEGAAQPAAQGVAGGGDATPGSAEAASVPGGGSAALAPAEVLNRTPFALGGMEPPIVRRMPHKLASQLRSELHRALAQHPAVTETQAATFCEGLSQAAVVTAFLAAHLDIDLPTDASTTLATTLFRSRSPLLAGVLERLTRLEQTTNETASKLTRVHQDVRGLDQRSEIIEQGIAWAVAERAENLVRGANTVKDVDFNHPSAVAMRDKARAEIKDLRRREARPIR